MTTAYLITSTIVTPLYGKLVRHLRPQAVLHLRHLDLHRRLGAVHASRPRCAAWPRSAPCRASAPAACSRWRWRSSATSCRRVSAPSTRATSWPCSAPPACSARSSAASSPARRPSSASPAGAGSSSSTCRSRIAALVVGHANPAPAPRRAATTASTGRGAVALDRRPRAAAHRRRAGPRVGLGLGQRAALLRDRRPRARRPSSVIERAMGDEALVPLRLFQHPHRRRRHRSSRCSSAWACSAASPRCPLYLQIVKGATPTQAGLLLLPLTLGHHVRLDPVRPAHLPDRALPDVPHHRRRRSSPRLCFVLHYAEATPRCGRR